ncbi:hypothetical protein SWZG_00002 [Synechococcus phage S-SKS1]|uniref:2OG-Fe(II) oxygenase n=1 Tax=Synechococcus phage S-SKS1 TaxID=754042 RepID=M4QPH2_9CAUD|nr:2OG-Fe(II) oxygenase [Synechococcus phage S-SKS1]AGH31515.1 hypothetical protein SWZG_00002 [Synechococcus phage S-SKS1]
MAQLKEGIIFPTNFYIADLFNEHQNQKYKNFLMELSKRTEGERRSNRNGWQSDTFLWKENIFKPLLDETLNASKIIANNLSNKELPQMVVRAMWGNINPKGGFNFTHVHPSGWLSGVYYIQLPEKNNEIVFQDPRSARMMDFQRSSLIKDEYFSHYPKVGELLLFPSWLPHFVTPNTSDQNRISISFNVELIV